MVTHLRGMNKTIEAETAEERLATRNSLAKKHTHENTSNEGEEDTTQKENLGSFDTSSFYSQQHMMDNYEKTRALKNEINKASFKFNMKPKNGIAYMQQKGLICKEPKEQMVKEIVAFLKETPQLNKTIIGDYMGEDIEVNKLVLYSFIDSIDFKGIKFVEALRLLLQGFRLPGEGQKVDRIMEKFGEKYVHDNPDIFASAESVYLLSYATIMAQTSIHNPQAQKCLMTLEDYTKMLRGIDGGKNLDPEFVASIYRTIEKEPFTLDEDEDLRLKVLGQNANSKLKKHETYIQEADMLAKRGKAHINSKGSKKEQSDQFILVTETEHIKTMFEDTWSANLAVFSVLLEESDDERIT
jgi:brefeldin A-inhibited guanine nucleotide-exchange protein